MRRWPALLIFLLTTGPACSVDADIARFPAPIVADTGPEVDSGAFTCLPGMIHLGTHCIDALEVTKRQYQAFLASKPGVVSDPRCAWSSKHDPRVAAESPVLCTAEKADLSINPDSPVVCVDWCDALAYCAWAGKRLCGAIGGGPEPYKDTMNDVAKSQWYAACAGGESTPRDYPYAGPWESGRCADVTSGVAQNVGSKPLCRGPNGTPQAAVFDLSGNVYEWTDNCQVSSGDQSNASCIARGGFFKNEETAVSGWMKCAAVNPYVLAKPRNTFDDHIGIRCCTP